MRYDIFATPFWHIEEAPQQLVDDLCKNIAVIKENIHLYQKSLQIPSTLGTSGISSYSNQGGYQTAQFVWKNFHPYGIKYIEKLVADIFVDYNVDVTGWWYNINPQGAWNLPHSHGGVDYALVWYLTDSDGLLRLVNPHSNRIDNIEDGSFNAKKGDILIFPADIIHYVMPNTKETDRVCISMNLKLYNHPDLQLC